MTTQKDTHSSRYARSLIEASLDPLVTISANGKIMDVNSATEKVTGVTRDRLIGSDFSDYFTDPQKARDGYQLVFSQGMVKDYPLAICHVSGTVTDVLYNATVYRNDNGHIAGVFAAARDVTELKRAQQKLEQALSQMQLIREMSDLLQSCQNNEEAYPIIESAFGKLFQESSGGIYIPDKNDDSLLLVAFWGRDHIESVFTADECWAMRRGRLHMPQSDHSLNPRCLHVAYGVKNYICVPLQAHARTLGLIFIQFSTDGVCQTNPQQITFVVETAADSARLALANLALREELRALSIRDPLTGLFNRRFLEEALNRELVRMTRVGKMLAVAMIDIDHFKLCNDNFGHDAGDEVLKRTSQLLMGFRQGNDLVCRYGGEEFVLVMTEIMPETVVERIETLRVSIEKSVISFGGHLLNQITVSVGVAIFPLHGNNQTDLIKSADLALYEAKESGRNRVCLFRPLQNP